MKWFDQSKVEKGKDCENQCSVLITDMSTFQCPNQCEILCNDCEASPKWLKLFKSKISLENNKFINTPSFTKEEIELILQALEAIPDSYIDTNLKGIVKMDYQPSPFTHSQSLSYTSGYIIVYRKALRTEQTLPQKFLHELAHHMHESSNKKLFKKYKDEMKYEKGSRPGEFIKPDSKFSPEEDFATNLENYLFNQNKLSEHIPKAVQFFDKYLDNKYKLKRCTL